MEESCGRSLIALGDFNETKASKLLLWHSRGRVGSLRNSRPSRSEGAHIGAISRNGASLATGWKLWPPSLSVGRYEAIVAPAHSMTEFLGKLGRLNRTPSRKTLYHLSATSVIPFDKL